MKAAEFKRRFKLHVLNEPKVQFTFPGTFKKASVLIPIIDDTKGLRVLLTKRAQHLKHHPGQISFPGGRAEPSDKDLIHTALREAQEEIGLPSDVVKIVGKLNRINTISGYQVTPVVGFIPKGIAFSMDTNEVEEIFSVPLKHFLNVNNHQTVMVHKEEQSYPVYFMPYKAHNIWGATAAILKDLAEHLSV